MTNLVRSGRRPDEDIDDLRSRVVDLETVLGKRRERDRRHTLMIEANRAYALSESPLGKLKSMVARNRLDAIRSRP